MNPTLLEELVEESGMIALSLTDTPADPESDVLVKDNDYRTTTVEWDDWD